MPAPTSSEIGRQFLDFFREKGHAVVLSAPLVPQNGKVRGRSA